MSNSKCANYAFGFIPSDIQVSNATVTDTLVACKEVTSMPVVSIETSESEAISNSLGVRTPLRWNLPIVVQPSSFQASPTTFIIPESGLYQVNTTVTYTEFSGTAAILIGLLTVNGQDLYGLTYSPIDTNQTDIAVGNVSARFSAGDSLVINSFQFAGGSPDIKYVGQVGNLNLTRLSIHKIGN
jgi:hypothetical protein